MIETEWIKSRIIHAPVIPLIFDGNYQLPVDFWYIIEEEENKITYFCPTKSGVGLINDTDVGRIHSNIYIELKQKFPDLNVYQCVEQSKLHKAVRVKDKELKKACE